MWPPGIHWLRPPSFSKQVDTTLLGPLNKVAEQHIDKKSHTCETALKAFNSGYELKEAMDHMGSMFKELYTLVTDLQQIQQNKMK